MENCPICSINIFSRLEGDEVLDLSRVVKIKEYGKDQTVFRQDEDPAKLHLLFDGQLKSIKLSEDGKETVLHMIESGEPFSMVPYFLDIPYTGTCIALKKSTVGEIERDDFVDILKKHPEISLKIMASMAQRTKGLLMRIEVQTSLSPKDRLMKYLVAEKEAHGSSHFDLALSKSDLARVLGMEPETLSRCFSSLSKDELIQVNGKSLTIL